MSKFPNTGSSSNGNRVIEKAKIDNELYFDNLEALGPNWGEAFVTTAHNSFSGSPSQKYKLNYYYNDHRSMSFEAGMASTGTDLFLCGTSSVRPSKYNIATGEWTEDGLAYNDYGSLDIAVGAFGYNGNAYFYTNSPTMTTSVNFFEIKKYDPVANTWTTLTPLSANNLATVIYGFMGIAGGAAYFMQIIKSSNASYVPAGFPCLYKYVFASDSWVAISVTPPLTVSGGVSDNGNNWVALFRGNNSMSCQYSDTEFLIHVKGPKVNYSVTATYLNTGEIYKFNTSDNTFTYICSLKTRKGLKTVPVYSEVYFGQTLIEHDTHIFYNNGIVYMWSPYLNGLRAYSLSTNKQYFVPIESSAIIHPMLCYEGGKIYMFSGVLAGMQQVAASTGIIIDLEGISAFLNKEKTLAVNIKSFD